MSAPPAPTLAHAVPDLADNIRALRLLVVAALALDAASSFRDLQVAAGGWSVVGLTTTLQLLLTPVAAALVMWQRPRPAVVLGVVVLGLALVNRPTSEELWLLLVVAVAVTARARARVVLLVVAVELAYALLFAVRVGRRLPGEGPSTALVVVLFCTAGHLCGLVVRRFLRAQERRRQRLVELELQNEEIRATERRRLADDLQTVVTGGLSAVQGQLARLGDPSTDGRALRLGLDWIDRESRAVLTELRGLLEVLRRPDPLPDEAGDAGTPTHRLVAVVTARPVRLATTAAAVLLAARAAAGWDGSLLDPRLAVQVLGWAALALGFWAPRAATLVAVGALTASVGAGTPDDWDVLPLAVLFFLGALRTRLRRLWLLVAVLVGYGGLLALTSPAWADRLLVASYAAAVATVAGLAARHFLELDRAATSYRAGLLQDRDQVGSRERSAAARELHDVVAHQLSLTTLMILATSASTDRETLLGTLRRVEECVETTDRELLALLHAMRGTETDDVRPSPLVLPSAGADTFARRLSASGFWPDVAVDPAADDLDATTQRTLGRIMQEATTNIVRYAPPGSSCSYALSVSGDEVRLRVGSPLPDGAATSTYSLGWGLRGVAERVELSHGTFSAGAREGSWLVDVSLPRTTDLDLLPVEGTTR